MSGPLTVWFVRHGEIASHRGDVPLTPGGVEAAESAGERLALSLTPGASVEFLHAPTRRTLETAQALRRGVARSVDQDTLDAPRVELAIRNADLYVAGTRVEMVSSVEALAEQLPEGTTSLQELAANDFFARFWAEHDRTAVWLRDPDPRASGPLTSRVGSLHLPGASRTPAVLARYVVCVTHSGPLRAILLQYLTSRDPGEPPMPRLWS